MNDSMKNKMLLVLSLVLMSGCVAAPPIRSVSPGAPDLMKKGAIRVGGGPQLFLGWQGAVSGGVTMAYGLTDRLQLELGGDFNLFTFDDEPNSETDLRWAMGYAGARLQPLSLERGTRRIVLDLEFGLGGGAGGVQDCHSDSMDCTHLEKDDLEWYKRGAFGGYAGAGLGFWFDRIGLYARGLTTLVKAENIPTTFHYAEINGVAWKIPTSKVDLQLHVGAGFSGFVNDIDEAAGLSVESGVTLTF
jgi:hypothetical protein